MCVLQCLNYLYCCSDVDTVSLEFEAPPEALQASHLRMRPVKEQQRHKRKHRKGNCSNDEYFASTCTYSRTLIYFISMYTNTN